MQIIKILNADNWCEKNLYLSVVKKIVDCGTVISKFSGAPVTFDKLYQP